MSKVYHPDKSRAGSDVFIVLSRAKEVLLDPVWRSMYDGFGPGISEDASLFKMYQEAPNGLVFHAGFAVCCMELIPSRLIGSQFNAFVLATLFFGTMGEKRKSARIPALVRVPHSHTCDPVPHAMSPRASSSPPSSPRSC